MVKTFIQSVGDFRNYVTYVSVYTEKWEDLPGDFLGWFPAARRLLGSSMEVSLRNVKNQS